jgi:hypothetical protein
MNFFQKQLTTHKSLLISLTVVGTVALGSAVTLPFTFTAGTPAKAAEVNDNFAAVKTAVDDNFARIKAMQTLAPYTPLTFLPGWKKVAS